MSDYHAWPTIQSVTPTLCRLLGIPPPALCNSQPLNKILNNSQKVLNGSNAQKCLVFAPDAIGNQLYELHPSLFAPVIGAASEEASLQSVVPPVTPTCFASMFTGAEPAQHGIQKHDKPVLKCDTLFDALVRANKRVAIAAVKGCSIDRIFRDRAMDYFSEDYDPDVTMRVLSLLKADQHSFILAYHQEYDDKMHTTTPFDPEAIQAARNNIAGFADIAEAFDRYWSKNDRIIVFAPDHGAHLDPAKGKGTHGIDIREDMELKHFYGFRKAA
jgi:hypothetical protein